MAFTRPGLGLAAKFSFFVSLPILIALSLLSYHSVKFSERNIRMGMMEAGKSMARAISISSEYGILIENRGILNNVIKRTIKGEDVIHVFIRNKSGEVLVSYGKSVESTTAMVIVDDPTASKQEAEFSYRMAETDVLLDITCDVLTVRNRRNREDIGILQPNMSGSVKAETIGTVQIGLSKIDMVEYLRKAKLGIVGLTAVVIALGVLATIVLVRAMVKPIKQLAMAAGDVSRGNFDHPVEVKSQDEIGDLAGSFNKMVADLKRSRDETEQYSRELEENAKKVSQNNEELNSFVYTVSHDLKAPVVSLQGFSSLLMKDYEDRLDETGKMYIERILKNSERMGILIEDLLELSRIGRMEGQERPVSISDIVSDAVDELAPQLEERGTKLKVKDDMPTLLCDRTMISQIFVNLISNANKFMGEDNEDPTIEVGYNDQDGYHEFYVRDNGIGIDEEYHEKVFQIFQRLDDIDTEGTGVGLAIVKKIVENFGGRIWVDSAKGKGTTMYFTVPETVDAD